MNPNICTDYAEVDVGEDFIDPRVQIELEQLNSATDAINKLEVELDEARASFRQLLSDSSQKINHLSKKLGSCIDKARPYYEARMKAKEAHTETQKAALKFERANSAHAAAKEMVFLAEEGLQKEGRTFDPAWQEMLNHATMRVNEAEHERTCSEVEHRTTSQAYNEAEQKVQQLQKDLKRAISKSSLTVRRQLLQLNGLAYQHQLLLLPYFEMKAQFNQLMEEQKKEVQKLEEQILYVKQSYAVALHNLEEISDEIHQRRQQKQECQSLGSRGPGVGAESPVLPPQDRGTSTNDINMSLNTDDFYLRLPKRLGPLRDSSTCMPESITAFVQVTLPTTINPVDSGGVFHVNQESQTETYVVQSKTDSETVLKDSAAEQLDSDRVSAWVHESGLRALAAARRASLLGTAQPTHSRLQGLSLPARFMAEESDMSDAESLTSTDVLTDEQIASLMLDKEMEEAYQDIMVVPKHSKELSYPDNMLNELHYSCGKSEHNLESSPTEKLEKTNVLEVNSVAQTAEISGVVNKDSLVLPESFHALNQNEGLVLSSDILCKTVVLNEDSVDVNSSANTRGFPDHVMKVECECNLVHEADSTPLEILLKETQPVSNVKDVARVKKHVLPADAVTPVQEIKVVAVQFTVTETVVTPKMTRAIDKRSKLPSPPDEKQFNTNVTDSGYKNSIL